MNMIMTKNNRLHIQKYDKKVAEPPLKFEDIVHGATYDKMRPPKPGGKSIIIFLVFMMMIIIIIISIIIIIIIIIIMIMIIIIMIIINNPGQAAKVLFHVTVMSLDSIDEGSMVRKQWKYFKKV